MTDDDPWLTDAQQCVWRRWTTVESLLSPALHRELQADAGLSLSDFVVLVQLTESEDGRVRVSDLGRRLTWEKSRTSHHLTRMEGRGLVRRELCPTDARGAFAVVTTEGRAAMERAAPGHARAVRELIFDHLTDAELATLSDVFDGVLARLEA